MTTFQSTIQDALSRLSTFTKSAYAAAVIEGAQAWSGADLKGNARKYGAHYARMRRSAESAWRAAGGTIIACERGAHESAVYIGMDDYGNALYQSWGGVYVQRSRHRAVRV